MAAPVIQFKRGQFANLPGLRAGEPGFTTDKYDLYVGLNSTSNGNKFFGSHRYWTKETTTEGSAVRIVEGSDNGENYIELKAPAALASNLTLTFPNEIVTDGYLKVAADGTLTWDDTLDATNVNATGVGTVAFLQSTTVNVSAGATVGGALDVDGGADISGGETTLSSATVSDLTEGRVLLAGTSGSLEDSANLTFGANGLTVTGEATVSAGMTVTGAANAGSLGIDGTQVVSSARQLQNIASLDATTTATIEAAVSNAPNDFDDIVVAGIATFQDAIEAVTINATGIVTASSGFVGDLTGNVTGNVTSTGSNSFGQVSVSGVTTSTGGFVGDLTGDVTGNADTATALETARNFSASGDATAPAVSFDGTGNVDLALTLANSGVSAGAYGSQTEVPVITVDAKGRITSATTAAVGTALTVTGDSGSEQINLLNEALAITGGANVTTSAASNGVEVALDADISVTSVNSSTVNVSAGATIGGAADLNGTLDVAGEATLASAIVSDLTNGRVVLAGTSGAIEDSADLTFGANGLTVGGQLSVSGVTTSTGGFVGDLTGDVTGDVTGDLTGNVTGNVSGNVTGDVTGNINSTGVSTIAQLEASTVNATGIVSATSFATGAEGSALIVTSNSITGPSSFFLDPAGVGDNTGRVIIKGDLQVDGTQTIVNSTTVTVADKNVMLADGAANDAAADGGGITVQSGDGNKTFQFEATGDNFGSSENINLATGKVLKVNNTEVLSATALSSSVVVDVASLDIDGASETAALADADLFVIDDGGAGTNQKLTAANLKSYVLGGGAGATFEAIKVTGIATLTQTQTNDIIVSAGATVSGALDVDGGADISGGETTLSSATVSDLTDGRIVLAGASGALQDSANLTFGDNGLFTAGDVNVSGIVTASSGFVGALTGNVTGDVTGNADTATALETARNFSASGDATAPNVSFDGTGNVDLALTLANSGVTAATYGSQTEIPVVTVDAKGRVTSMSTASVGTALTVTGDSGSEDINLLTEALSITGGTNVTTSAASNGVEVALDADISLTSVTATGIVTASSGFVGDLTGNADTATVLETARNFSASGDASASAVSFNGSGNVDLALTLATVNSDTGSFGSQTQIPVVTVNDKGLVTAVTTASVGTALTVTGDTGSEDINLLTEALALTGGTNITSSAASNGVEFSLDSDISLTSVNASQVNVSGVVTATSFITGAEGSSMIVNSDSITGPATITIDPAGVGDNTGRVIIKGDLQVDGTQTIVNSTSVTVTDKNVMLAEGAANDAAADGGGITVQSGDGNKTFQFEETGDNFGSSENLNLASGKVLKVNNTEILSATTLGSSVVNSSLTSVGTLGNLTVAGGINGAISNAGVSTLGQLQVTDVNASGIVSATDFRDTDGSLVPLVGVSSASSHTGLVTAFKFVGTGLEEYTVENEVATIRVSGVAASTYTTSSTITATDAQTTFTFAPGYTEGFVDVYLNGIRLITGTDFTANDESTVVLASGATAGDEVEIVSFKELGDLIHVQNLKSVDNLTAGIVTATSTNFSTLTAGISTIGNMVVGTGSTDVIVNGDFQATGTVKIGDSTIILDSATDIITAAGVNLSGVTTSTGGFVGDLTGNSDSATQLQTARNFSASGDATASAVSFNGTDGVDLALTLATVNSDTGSFGSQTQIPVVTVNEKGLVTAVSTANVGTALTVAGDTGSEDINLLTETLTISGGTNVTTSASSDSISVDLDSDISLTSVNATTVNVSAGTTVGGALDVNGGADISGGETTLSSATVSDLTSGRVVLAGTSGALEDSANLTFNGTILSAPQVSATTSATLASAAISDLTDGRIVLAGASGELEDSANLTFGANGLTVTGGSIVSAASTFSDNLDVGGNVIVTGDLTVNGTTTQLNTTQTTVEDVLLELQVVDGSAPASDTNKDVGIVMNYFSGSAKKAAVYWDDSAARFALSDDASETNGVLTASSYSGLEIGSLYLNDCAGASQVISCSGTTRSLENISIDGGTF